MRPEPAVRGRTPWAGSTRAARLPAGWARIRARILARDGHRCRTCGAPATDVDHIVPGDNHHDANLAALCRACHRAKSAREGQTAMVAARHRRGHLQARPPEPHPGLRATTPRSTTLSDPTLDPNPEPETDPVDPTPAPDVTDTDGDDDDEDATPA